jgi:diaminohydroxyphosphoribosylaminopyrimidine deaminase/5-amino-6-(5-phosphoribosylamino)uracil reductase
MVSEAGPTGESLKPADHAHMERALILGERSSGLASPNPAVGCLIVRNGEVVGEGWHEYPAVHHAETRALWQAGERARGATAYVTLEPCSHQGRTPPCAESLIASGVKRVVVAQIDPNPQVSGNGIRRLREAGIEVDTGPERWELARRAAALIEPFARHVTSGLPLVVGKVGMSMDGKIAAAGHPGGRINSDQGRDFGQQLRLRMDAILVGVGTVLADDPLLTYRGPLPKSAALGAVILDSRLRTPPSARVFSAEPPRSVLIFCGPAAPVARRHELESRGAEILTLQPSPQGLPLDVVLGELGRRRFLGVLVEGGSLIHWSFLSSRLVDKFFFIVAPVVLGGAKAVPAVGGAGYPSAAEAPPFRIAALHRAGPDLVLEAYPAYSRSILSRWVWEDRTPDLPPEPPAGGWK